MKNFKLALITLLGAAVISVFGFMATAGSEPTKCTMDVQCGAGKKCVSGVCTGGIDPSIKGKCVRGNFGQQVCDNTGKPCNNDSECWR